MLTLALQISECRFQIGLSVQPVISICNLNLQSEISNLQFLDC
jgi:hypothetical protein